MTSTAVDEISTTNVRLRSHADGLRWSSPEAWHITLQFLGNTTPERYQCLIARLRELRSPPIPITLGSVEIFDRTGVLFVGVRLTSELTTLQQRVTAVTRPCGFLPETRPYHPHITLARSKGKAPAPSLRELKSRIRQSGNRLSSIRPPANLTKFLADAFCLYESFPAPGGSRYKIRERFRLNRSTSPQNETQDQ